MKKLLFLFISISVFQLKAQVADFMYVAGTSSVNAIGIYGTIGVPSSTVYPGSRNLNSSWADQSGNVYVFGGNGYSTVASVGTYNDLWKYNQTLDQWTWLTGTSTMNALSTYGVKGVPSVTNTPGAKWSAMTWTDNNGKFWLFGGNGQGSVVGFGNQNDLWMFDPLTNEWTWKAGSTVINAFGVYGTKGVATASTTPGARNSGVTWVDANNNLWLFGGTGLAASGSSGLLNDLWKFDITTNQWVWVSGNNSINNPGVYGTQGTPAAANIPGSRSNSAAFVGAGNTLWLYGGNGIPGTMIVGNLSDLWKYDIVTNQWTFMKGTTVVNSVGVYGTKSAATATVYPGGRYTSYYWTDNQNNFWMYGGYGAGATSGNGTLNDLWQYNSSLNMWVWVSGANAIGQAIVYGTKGVASFTNTPGSRIMGTSVKDSNGDLWLYAGSPPVTTNYTNDLWKIHPCNAPAAPLSVSATQTICVGSVATLTASTVGTLGWYSAGVGGTYLGNGTPFTTPTLTSSTTFYVQDSTCAQSVRKAVLVIVSQPTVSIAGTNTVCLGSSATLTASGVTTYTWSTAETTNTISVTPGSLEVYTVTGTNGFGCITAATKTITTVAVPSVSVSGSATICSGSGVYLTASGANTYTWNTGSTAATILAGPSSTTIYTVTGKATSTGCTAKATGTVTISTPTVIITGSTSVCKGTAIDLSVSGASTYTWSTGTQSTSINVIPMVSTVYTVNAKDAFGCNGSDTHTITVLQTPTVVITGTTAVCNGSAITLTGTGATSYTWNTGSTNTVETFTPSSLTVYTITGTGSNGCIGVANKTVTINALPTLTVNATSTLLCSGQVSTITATGASTYTWNTTQFGASIMANPSSTSDYIVTGTAANTCMNTATITIYVNTCTGINQVGNNMKFSIYPNPNSGELVVEVLNDTKLIILNAVGEIIHAEEINAGETHINLINQPAGIYFVQLKYNNEFKSIKIVKQQ